MSLCLTIHAGSPCFGLWYQHQARIWHEKNLPVTSNERTFDAAERLISTTDVHGTILHCNDAFVSVSGYTREELIGQPHNLVRHPDMPPWRSKSCGSTSRQDSPGWDW
ncbi:PAS domain S-box protein [Oceanimonas sp. NS1]|nr:PAS domain S-box protein [Oceanimonas sp. NS1]